ncbi:MAG: hypothetical protein WA991_12050, partial [Ornithinimicrobium sp.]
MIRGGSMGGPGVARHHGVLLAGALDMPLARPLVAGCGAWCSQVPSDAGGGDGGGEVAVVDQGVVSPAEQG